MYDVDWRRSWDEIGGVMVWRKVGRRVFVYHNLHQSVLKPKTNGNLMKDIPNPQHSDISLHLFPSLCFVLLYLLVHRRRRCREQPTPASRRRRLWLWLRRLLRRGCHRCEALMQRPLLDFSSLVRLGGVAVALRFRERSLAADVIFGLREGVAGRLIGH